MTGNPDNAAVWAGADVYVGALTATEPTGGADFGAEWDAVGLLNGDDGFTESMETETNDFYAWGGILIATTRRNFKLTRQFTAYEDNETVYGLVYPGSELTFDGSGGYEGDLKTPNLQHMFKIGFQTNTGDTIKRVISRNYAQVDERGDSTESESDLASRQLTVAIYPDSGGTLFGTYKGPVAAPTG